MAKKFKSYGRKNTNKLDWLLAIACVIIGVAALWISLGISLKNAGAIASVAFRDVLLGLGFIADSTVYGQAAVLAVYNTVIIYGSFLLLVLGTIYLFKKDKKDRVPGLVAEFVAAVGFAFYLSFVYELMSGTAKGSVALAFPIVLILFLVALGCLAIYATYLTFSGKSVELKKKEEPVYEDYIEEPVKEEPVVEEKKEEEPEPQPEPEEEPEEEEEDEEEVEDDEDEDTSGNFKNLGKRNKRVPFEKKIRKADLDTKARYNLIVNALREFDFNDRISIPGETFSYKREKLVFLTFSGKTLKAYFRLNAKDFEDSPIPVKDASELKKYESTPCYLKVKSDLAARRVVALATQVAKQNDVPAK